MSEQKTIQLHPEWLAVLAGEFEKPYMTQLKHFLVERSKQGVLIYPSGSQFFAALDSTPLSEVKVVILGQDPYHGPGQAHGLAFSVQPGIAIPPSLLNIFKAIQFDLGLPIPNHGHLMHWARQGVLLLNTVLSVERGQAGAHQGKGWEPFTDAVIRVVNQKAHSVVFLLWGAHAQRKAKDIDQDRHLVLNAPHPSPLSAHRGFLDCRHFSKTNDWLTAHQRLPIDWSLPVIA
jgi:uracil-DNA glycosylase